MENYLAEQVKEQTKLVLDVNPTTLGLAITREQTIGEVRGLSHLHVKVVEALTSLHLDNEPEKKEQHERRNAVDSDPTV